MKMNTVNNKSFFTIFGIALFIVFLFFSIVFNVAFGLLVTVIAAVCCTIGGLIFAIIASMFSK